MNLSNGQQQALILVRDTLTNFPEGGGVGVISGYAGTGKTTLIQVLNEELEGLLVVTPTGKAALRVQEASGAEARTIHSWLYEANEDEETGLVTWGLRDLKEIQLPAHPLLIVDEASMVTLDVFRDVYTTCKALGLNLVLIGDGFQLPPVETDPAKQAFSVFGDDFPANWKVQLTEIHRQALDNPIIRISMAIREGRWVASALGELPTVVPSALQSHAKRVWEGGGATICYKNATRHSLNRLVRQSLGYDAALVAKGEPLLCTQNNYDLEVYNGEIVDVGELSPINLAPVAIRDNFKNTSTYVNYLETTINTGTGSAKCTISDKEVLGTLGDVGVYPVRRGYAAVRRQKYGEDDEGHPMGPPYLHANLGYSLTCHKSQGSEFAEILVVIEDGIRLTTTEGRRWCYTAITRAKKKASICWNIRL